MTYRKKLIEVALPLDIINETSAYDKMPGIGPHPKGIHHWWARLPLPAARAILFASLVDDPSSDPSFADENDSVQDRERFRLFGIIREMLQKKIHEHPDVFRKAFKEINRSSGGNLPVVLDPFAGGGSIPLESQRLGLHSIASDINPIAVLINKVQLELLPKFSDHFPVHPAQEKKLIEQSWHRANGLASDVRFYSKWMQEEAQKRLEIIYPQIELPSAHGGGKSTVIAWIWTRTVKCSNPACGVEMPLVRSFNLSTKKGKEVLVEPIINRNTMPPTIRFTVETGTGKPQKGTVNRRGATCICCGKSVTLNYLRTEGQNGRLNTKLMAVVAQGLKGRGRIYLSPLEEYETVARQVKPATDLLDTSLPEQALGFRVQNYGLTKHRDLFTPRQLVALTIFSDLLKEVHKIIVEDAKGYYELMEHEDKAVGSNGSDPVAYANAVVTFLAFGVDRCADFNNALCRWSPSNEKVMNLFSRQAIPMVWDFAEANLLADSVGGWITCTHYIADCIEVTLIGDEVLAQIRQDDAVKKPYNESHLVVSTDPPYYDNIGYADLSDFFYVWARHSLKSIYPELFGTLLVPKKPELVAAPERFENDKELAKKHFETGFQEAFTAIGKKLDPRYPMTVYYAFKQADTETDDPEEDSITLTTGWETLLEALVNSGFQVTGTWPINASQKWRMRSMDSNALASYIVLVCRPRSDNALLATRRDFLNALKRELPTALKQLQHSNIAPVDLAQASIGPGMTVFSRYQKIIEADGSAMRVRTALALINQALDEYLSEQEGEYDSDTRWALTWFEQYAFNEGPFGDAETLSKAKNTSVGGMVQAGILSAGGGKVRLLRREELPADWDPVKDRRVTVWEVTQYLIRVMQEKGEAQAAVLLNQVGDKGEIARDLAYRLYTICERKGWAQEALPYNSLVVAWSDVGRMALDVQKQPVQGRLI